jgi:hypothetical protein
MSVDVYVEAAAKRRSVNVPSLSVLLWLWFGGSAVEVVVVVSVVGLEGEVRVMGCVIEEEGFVDMSDEAITIYDIYPAPLSKF